MMAFLVAAFDVDEVGGEQRTVLRLHPRLAPYKVAVLPLSKKETLTPTAREVLHLLQPHMMCDYDETQSIGRRYRRQDEIGTRYCVTVDFETLEDRAVTVRDRDTTAQDRVAIDGLLELSEPSSRSDTWAVAARRRGRTRVGDRSAAPPPNREQRRTSLRGRERGYHDASRLLSMADRPRSRATPAGGPRIRRG